MVDPLRKVPPASGDVPRKNVYARPLPVAFPHRPRGSPSGLLRCPEKVQLQAAFGFWSFLYKKPLQPSEMSSGNTFTSGSLRLLVNPFRKISPVARCDDPKKCSSRQLPAFGQYFAKNHSSSPLRRLEKERLQTAFGFWSIPCEKYLQSPEMCPEKTLRPDDLRLWIYTEQKASPAARCDNSKKSSSKKPSAFGRCSAKSLFSARRYNLKKRSR